MNNELLGDAFWSLAPELIAYAKRTGRRSDTPEDIVQDAFLRVYRQIGHSNTEEVRVIRESDANNLEEISPLVLEALRMVAFCAARSVIQDRRKRRVLEIPTLDHVLVSLSDGYLREDSGASLLDSAALCELALVIASSAERVMLALVKEGHSHREIAEVCRTHASTIGRRLHRLRNQLVQFL